MVTKSASKSERFFQHLIAFLEAIFYPKNKKTTICVRIATVYKKRP